MTRQEIETKIYERRKDMSDAEWIELYDESLKLETDEFHDFARTLAGRILAQWGGIVKRRNGQSTL